jgi:RNA polymerase sigma-70 factor (ECF subfamily)
MGQNDAELVTRSKGGDADAFGDLVLRYQDRIFATVYRILGNGEDAREMAQEAFFRAWAKLDTFREGARFSTWLYTITLNLTRSELRKRKTRRHIRPVSLNVSFGDGDGRTVEPPSKDEGPLVALGQTELHELALREVERLDTEAREVVVLRDMQELSYEEIADVLGCPIGTVRSRLHRARGQLRDRLTPLLEASRKGGAA